MRTRNGWVPQQHGAWAMLLVPFLVGVILRARAGLDLPVYLWVLLAAWLSGYFAFDAAVLWIKAPRPRRATLAQPLATYAAASAACGIGMLALAGPQIASWIIPFAALTLAALTQAGRRRERSTLSGALTTAAAALLIVVVVYPDPTTVTAWTSDVQSVVADAALVFAYFFGTVLYVKTNIRQRSNPHFYTASVCWHAASTLAATLLAAWGLATPGWVALFAATTARAILMPRRRPRPTPRTIGLLEGAFCLAICLIVGFGG